MTTLSGNIAVVTEATLTTRGRKWCVQFVCCSLSEWLHGTQLREKNLHCFQRFLFFFNQIDVADDDAAVIPQKMHIFVLSRYLKNNVASGSWTKNRVHIKKMSPWEFLYLRKARGGSSRYKKREFLAGCFKKLKENIRWSLHHTLVCSFSI